MEANGSVECFSIRPIITDGQKRPRYSQRAQQEIIFHHPASTLT
jgi:hypothetical protein